MTSEAERMRWWSSVAGALLGMLVLASEGPEVDVEAHDRADTNRAVATTSTAVGLAQEGSDSQAVVSLPVEEAFSRAMARLKGRVDVSNVKGWIRLRRGETNHWVMTINNYPGLISGSLQLTIRDSGAVELHGNLRDTAHADAELTSSIPSPQEAFQKAVEALGKRIDFTEPEGRIMFTRSESSREWLLRLKIGRAHV